MEKNHGNKTSRIKTRLALDMDIYAYRQADFDPSGSQNPWTDDFDETWHGWLRPEIWRGSHNSKIMSRDPFITPLT